MPKTIPLKDAYPELQAMLDRKDARIRKLEIKIQSIKEFLAMRGRSDTKTGILAIINRD